MGPKPHNNNKTRSSIQKRKESLFIFQKNKTKSMRREAEKRRMCRQSHHRHCRRGRHTVSHAEAHTSCHHHRRRAHTGLSSSSSSHSKALLSLITHLPSLVAPHSTAAYAIRCGGGVSSLAFETRQKREGRQEWGRRRARWVRTNVGERWTLVDGHLHGGAGLHLAFFDAGWVAYRCHGL